MLFTDGSEVRDRRISLCWCGFYGDSEYGPGGTWAGRLLMPCSVEFGRLVVKDQKRECRLSGSVYPDRVFIILE